MFPWFYLVHCLAGLPRFVEIFLECLQSLAGIPLPRPADVGHGAGNGVEQDSRHDVVLAPKEEHEVHVLMAKTKGNTGETLQKPVLLKAVQRVSPNYS